MKLTRKKLIELIDLKNRGWASYQVNKKVGITVRRIDQIYKEYRETRKIPELGKSAGRPVRQITKEKEAMVRQVYGKYNVCASQLRALIERNLFYLK
ncbi:hypothetical protein D6817_00835 [Candidatus Pacearchaeota archaeon]|nr:MAG: hypothetical protein D6817_00835 [Candidatus Pacearchaeota archaeon]